MEPEIHVPLWLVTTFGLYLLAQLIAAVWWASSMATTISYIKEAIDRLNIHEGEYVTKTDIIKDFAYRDQRIDAAWKKIDFLEATKQDIVH